MLRIKNEFSGMIISRLHPGLGTITFDPFQVKPEEYPNFLIYGFDFLFEEEEEKKAPRKNSVKNKIVELEAVKEVRNYAKTK
jgi:hypothetical protein